MAEVTFTPNHMPPPACYPSDFNGLLDQLTTGGGLTGTLPDTAGGGIFVGSTPPPSALTNKVWFKTDAAGRPLGAYMFYNGNWRKVYTGAVLGEIRIYAGNANAFDGSGRGLVGGDTDGWALCNGQNGAPNLIDHFIIAGSFDGGGWFTNATGAKTYSGGEGHHTINEDNLPVLGAQLHVSNTGTSGGSSPMIGSGNDPISYLTVTGGGGRPITGTQPLPLPPYICLGFMMFVGYQ